MDDIIPSVRTKPQKHESTTLIKIRAQDPTLQSYVVGKLGLGWSPEQIAGRLRKEINEWVRPPEEYINHESIYQYGLSSRSIVMISLSWSAAKMILE